MIIEDVVYEGGRQRRGRAEGLAAAVHEQLRRRRSTPTSRRLRTDLGEDADAVWGHCAGYPGRADAAAFAAYFRNHQLESALFFGAYGDRTVGQVRANLARRTRLIEFAMEAQGLAARRAAGALPGGVPGVTDALELASIQGFVVRGYRLPSAGYLFLRIDDAARARALLAEITPRRAHRRALGAQAGVRDQRRLHATPGLRGDRRRRARRWRGFPEEFRDGHGGARRRARRRRRERARALGGAVRPAARSTCW